MAKKKTLKPEARSRKPAARKPAARKPAARKQKAASLKAAVASRTILPTTDGLAVLAEKAPACVAHEVGHAGCTCPVCEEGRRNP